MKKLILLSIVSMLLFVPDVSAAIITFDDLALGDYGNSLRYGDVTIQTYPESHLLVTSVNTDRGWGNEHSLPNKLSVASDRNSTPDLPEVTSFNMLFDFSVQDVCFWLTGTFHDTTINVYNPEGTLVSTFVQTYPMIESRAPDGNAWDVYYDRALQLVNVEGSGIARLHIQPSAYDGFSIDDIIYNPVIEPTPVPEPATMLLLAPALLGLLGYRRKLV